MDYIESAGQTVLLSYGKFLDRLGTKLVATKETFSPHPDVVKTPIGIELQFEEHSSILELVETDNKVQNKILVVFTTLCKEIAFLQNEFTNNFLPNFVFYGDAPDSTDNRPQDQVSMSGLDELLVLLLDVLSFVRRCRYVLIQFLQQLNGLFSFPWKNADDHNSYPFKFREAFFSLGNLLELLVACDTAIANNSTIVSHFKILENKVKSAIDGNSSLDIDRLKQLNHILSEVRTKLFTGKIFKNAVLAQLENKIATASQNLLSHHLNTYLKNRINEIDGRKEVDSETLKLCSNLVVCYTLGVHLFGMTDKKLHKSVLELARKYAALPLFGEIFWVPSDFLARNLENRTRHQLIKNVQSDVLHAYLEQTGAKLSKELRRLAYKTFIWSLEIENTISFDPMNAKLHDSDTIDLCFEGIKLADSIKLLVYDVFNSHSMLNRPMTKTTALALCKAIELMKGIGSVFDRHRTPIARCLNNSLRKTVIHVLGSMGQVKREIIGDKSNKESDVDSYSSLVLAEKTLYGGCSQDRLLLVRLAMTLTNRIPVFEGQLVRHLDRLSTIWCLPSVASTATASHFLYSQRHIFSIYLKNLSDSRSELGRLQYLVNGLEDGSGVTDDEQQFEILLNTARHELDTNLLQDLCQEVETKLRLQAHSHLQLDALIPAKATNLRSVLRVPSLRILDRLFCVRGHIEGYLDRTFYDLTTVALHDWRTYKKMRSLAEHKFGLHTVEDNLPSQALSQGLDVLEIMRNINVFVSKYLYNLNNQCFVECSSNNKHLNTISICQIANSIWTHGTGIMNTTANFIYQFLRKKLVIFSQFLYDDNIKSRLMKDFNYFHENKPLHGTLYPFERAEKFNKGIVRLGVTGEGLTYLDQYRILISQIGNALAYVRMVRAGGLHHCLASSAYYPAHDLITISSKYSTDSTCDAVTCFRSVLGNMFHNLTEGTEYFKLLVDVFSDVFQSPENSHLRLFVMIIPPLTINFVRYIVEAKEKMNKRNRDGAVFTDDGFAMGIAYLLQVLDLNREFNSIHWFDAVAKKYREEEARIRKQADVDSTGQDRHENTIKLATKRLQVYKREFDLLKYNLESARVFFKAEQQSELSPGATVSHSS